MPSFKDTLDLVIHADANGAISELKRFSSETETQVKKSESSLQRLSSGALKLGVGGLAIGGILTQLGDAEKQAAGQLDAAISAAGQSAEEYKSKIEAADKAGEHFGHTADETDHALTVLVGSFGDTNAALDRMQLVEDLAAEKHIGLADAATIVAKAHGGAGRIFKEFNIEVKTGTDGTKDYDGALDELSKKLSGQASASVSGFTGWLKGLGATVEDDAAAFGQKFGPEILAVSSGLTALGGITQGVTAASKKLKLAREGATVADEAGGAASVGLATKLGAAGVAIGLAAAAYEGYSHSEQVSIDVSKASRASTEQLVNQFNGLENSLFGTGNAQHLFTQLAESSIPTAKRLRDGLAAQGKDVSALDAILQKEAVAQEQANADTNAGADATDKYTAALKANDEQLHSNLDPLFGLTKALQANAKARWEAAAAGDADAEKNQAAAESAIAVHDAVLKLETAMKSGTLSVQGAKNELAQFVSEGLLTQQQADQVAASLDGVAARADALDGKHIDITVDLHQGQVLIPDLGAAANNEFHGVDSNPLAGLPPGLDLSGGGGNPVRQQSAMGTTNIYATITAPSPEQVPYELGKYHRAASLIGN